MCNMHLMGPKIRLLVKHIFEFRKNMFTQTKKQFCLLLVIYIHMWVKAKT